MRVGKIAVYQNHNLVPIPDHASLVFIYKLSGSDIVYGMKSDGNYFPLIGNGVNSITLTDSATISFTETTGAPDYEFTANTKLSNVLRVAKPLITSAVLYCNITSAIAPDNLRYDSPEQAKINSSSFDSFDSPSIETGAMAGSFNSATGIWTVPENGFYNIGISFGYRMQSSDYHVFTSDGLNPAMTGNNWISAPGNIGSFAVALMTTSGASYLYLYSQKQLNEKVNNIYINTSNIQQLTAGQTLKIFYINDSDLPMYGCINSSIIFQAVKISE